MLIDMQFLYLCKSALQRYGDVRQIAAIGLVIYCMAISPAFAGKWRDDLEDGDLEGWESPDPNPGPEEKWGMEDGECSGQWANTPVGVASAVILA